MIHRLEQLHGRGCMVFCVRVVVVVYLADDALHHSAPLPADNYVLDKA